MVLPTCIFIQKNYPFYVLILYTSCYYLIRGTRRHYRKEIRTRVVALEVEGGGGVEVEACVVEEAEVVVEVEDMGLETRE